MSLHLALSHNLVTLGSSHKAYKEDVIAVCRYVSAVAGSSLPSLTHSPDHWDDFQNQYIRAKSDAQVWSNNVIELLLSVPDSIDQSYKNVLNILDTAIDQADALIQQPDDNNLASLLKTNINSVSGQVNLTKSSVSNVLAKLQNFSADLPHQAQSLNTLSEEAKHDANVDQRKVDELQDDIDRINDEIDQLSGAIAGLAIADGALLTLAIASVVVAGPWGAVTWPFLGIAAAAATTFLVLDSIKLANDKEKLKQKQQEVNEITQDIASLNALAKTFKRLSTRATNIQENLQNVIEAWNELEKGAQDAVEAVESARQDQDSKKWERVKADLENTRNDWRTIEAIAGPLKIQINANDGKFEVGQSRDEVEKAFKAGTNKPFVDFIRELS